VKKTLGVLGGMGPLATVYFFEKVVLNTDANCDQEHIHIIIENNTNIPDRTSYLLGKGDDPVPELIRTAKNLEKLGAEYLAMPCNTAHYFYDDIVREVNIPFLNMIEETLKYIKEKYKEEKKIGLLATDGTRKMGVYDRYFKGSGIELIAPEGKYQKNIMDFIYRIKSDLRAAKIDGFNETVQFLKNQGVNVFVLGCTELSSAYYHFNIKGSFIDPMEILAKKCINFAFEK
jgi:aspartate racemase